MTTTTIRVAKATHDILQRLARAEGRAIGQVVAEAIDRYDRQRALAELNASYARLAADPATWADWQTELTSLEGTLPDGLEDDPWNEDIADPESPHYPDIESLRGAAGTLERPLSSDQVREIARDDHLASKFTREP